MAGMWDPDSTAGTAGGGEQQAALGSQQRVSAWGPTPTTARLGSQSRGHYETLVPTWGISAQDSPGSAGKGQDRGRGRGSPSGDGAGPWPAHKAAPQESRLSSRVACGGRGRRGPH